MPLVPYDPFRMIDPLWREMDRYLQRGSKELSEWLYRVDIDETPSQVLVTAEIPGIEKPEDLYIQVDENLLTIRGEMKQRSPQEGRTARQQERYFGRFSRTMTLPAPVKADGAHASYRNGVLELTFEKDQHPAARRIEVDFH